MEKIVIIQRISDSGMKRIQDRCDYQVVEGLDAKAFKNELAAADCVLTKMAPLDREDIENCPHLKVIGRHGVGFDSVDVKAATERGIPVVVTPGANKRSVAEHTLAIILALTKNLVESSNETKEGNWNVRRYNKSFEFKGKRIGFLGLGNIGSELARMCRGIDLETSAYDPFLSDEKLSEMGCTPYHDVDQLLKDCDIVSIHVPLNDKTRNMIGWRELNLMKRSALIVNCARGGIINEADLAKALNEKVIAGAGLDVFDGEVLQADSPLAKAENLICTPHMAAITETAANQICNMMLDGCFALLDGKKWPYVADKRVYEHPKWKDCPWA